MAAKIVALVVVALALANAAPRDMSKLDNQVLEDKINEILSSSELMQSAQTEESPDWMATARRTNTSTITTVVTYTLNSISGFTAASANTPGQAEYGTLAGAYVNIVSDCSYTGTASVTTTCSSYFTSFSQSATASRRATVAATYSASGGSISASGVDQAMTNAGSSGIASAFNSAATSAGAPTGLSCSGASAAASTTAATSGVAQLTFGFAALLAALFAHLF